MAKMCKWGTDTVLRVNVPAELSHTGEAYWTEKGVDSCIADLVQAIVKLETKVSTNNKGRFAAPKARDDDEY